ncbi:hypothetical protein VNO77_18591 [Canavalia gladiata]|uniref:Uncharacterized protein n=1 Tax=Canavalia gladiata TaxID=3824 RepID=A0AAN9QJS6_CANGL
MFPPPPMTITLIRFPMVRRVEAITLLLFLILSLLPLLSKSMVVFVTLEEVFEEVFRVNSNLSSLPTFVASKIFSSTFASSDPDRESLLSKSKRWMYHLLLECEIINFDLHPVVCTSCSKSLVGLYSNRSIVVKFTFTFPVYEVVEVSSCDVLKERIKIWDINETDKSKAKTFFVTLWGNDETYHSSLLPKHLEHGYFIPSFWDIDKIVTPNYS